MRWFGAQRCHRDLGQLGGATCKNETARRRGLAGSESKQLVAAIHHRDPSVTVKIGRSNVHESPLVLAEPILSDRDRGHRLTGASPSLCLSANLPHNRNLASEVAPD